MLKAALTLHFSIANRALAIAKSVVFE